MSIKDLSFDRKYRPRTLDEYMGESIRKQLKNRLSTETLYPHTIILKGTRGCGKTTAARLIAKELLCLNKVDGHACCECMMCEEIDEKLIFSEAGMLTTGVTEVDIASDSKKTDMDIILDEALEEPSYPLTKKVLILDECHMASVGAQNRLLKITEEPPNFLYIIFCTTDPERMLPTLYDRCQLKIDVRKANLDELVQRLLYGCKKEGIETSLEALKILARSCDRNPRDCWKKLEEIAKDNGYKVTISTVSKAIGSIDNQIYIDYIKAANKDLYSILNVTNQLKQKDIKLDDFMRGLTKFILSCINIKYGFSLDEYPQEFIKQVNAFFKEYTSDEFDTLLQIVEYANNCLAGAAKSSEMAELLINNTALRIGKIKLLSIGLQNEAQKALLETRKGNAASIELTKAEQGSMNNTVITEAMSSDLMQSIFGVTVKEVKAGIKDGIVEEDNDSDEKTAAGLSDEELLEWCN